MEQLNTPVVFIIFNRPDTTALVFEEIKRVKPKELFIIADGPRENNTGDRTLCRKVRTIVDDIDWNCKVYKNFSETNLGCRQRVYTGLNWVFEHVETAIILEDDCLPSPSFFSYCEELLDRYKYDSRIMTISGNNFNSDYDPRNEGDYSFSRYPHIWGWATWKRAWDLYDINMSIWPWVRDKGFLNDILHEPEVVNYWYGKFQNTFSGKNEHSWDYQWILTSWLHRALTIIPRVNLVTNIGFGRNDATQTTQLDDLLSNLPLEEIKLPLTHPSLMIQDILLDQYTEQHIYKIQNDSKVLNVTYYKERWLELKLFGNDILQLLRDWGFSRIVIFGTKTIAKGLKNEIDSSNLDLVAFIDNKISLEKNFEGIPIFHPSWIEQNEEKFDVILLSIEGNHDLQVKKQLVDYLKTNNKQIISWKEMILYIDDLANKLRKIEEIEE
ncbi:hypothetical protein [Marinicrinis lubricantis]|uniref:Hemolytic protein HlpA-like protein n=1 Tax=Marinicrinis lubricantis TaxID=2086470 RepID=A0ABW1ISX0_9BACL